MIYIVEDDQSIRDLMIYTLAKSGYRAEGFADGEEFFAKMDEGGENPELIMLDIMLPGEDGISILKKLKDNSRTEQIPVMMTTAKGAEYDKVTGLDLGADDYLVKPFGMMEMVSRVRAVLRRAGKPAGESVIKSGDIEINTDERKVTSAGKDVTLTLKEFELLKLFVENPGKVFTREQLLASVWGEYSAYETRTVDVHIGTLRSKLGEPGNRVKTVRGVGYSWEKQDK